MAQKSSIDQLPAEVKLELDKLIESGRHTIDQMVEYMQDKGADVSRSAVGRHTKKINKAVAKLRESREVASALATEMGDKGEGEMSSAMREILRSFIFDFMVKGDKTPDPKQLSFLARSLKDIEHTAQISAKREADIRKEMIALAKEKATEAAKEVGKVTKDAGLSKEMAEQIRRQILGIGQ